MTAALTPNVREKAQRLLTEGRVTVRQVDDEFTVRGDTGSYRVIVPNRRLDLRGSCTCKKDEFGGRCSHVEAAKLWIERETRSEYADRAEAARDAAEYENR